MYNGGGYGATDSPPFMRYVMNIIIKYDALVMKKFVSMLTLK